MCFLKWTPDMEIGIVEIDMQHRNLLDIIGMLDDVVKEQSYGKKSKRILKEFNRFVKYHFNTEKEMFLKYNYEDKEHLNQHAEILKKLNELKYKDCGHECLKSIVTLGKTIFVEHTKTYDKKFGTYLKTLEK